MDAYPGVRVAVPMGTDEIEFAASDAGGPDGLVRPAATGKLLAAGTGLIADAPVKPFPSGAELPAEWLATDLPGLVSYVGAGGAAGRRAGVGVAVVPAPAGGGRAVARLPAEHQPPDRAGRAGRPRVVLPRLVVRRRSAAAERAVEMAAAGRAGLRVPRARPRARRADQRLPARPAADQARPIVGRPVARPGVRPDDGQREPARLGRRPRPARRDDRPARAGAGGRRVGRNRPEPAAHAVARPARAPADRRPGDRVDGRRERGRHARRRSGLGRGRLQPVRHDAAGERAGVDGRARRLGRLAPADGHPRC